MLSHACATCGKGLDDSSRAYSRELRMWVARCGRCGFAVRWAPRAAREPARVWARLRALNLRLGIAIGTLQLGILILLFAGSYLDGQLRRVVLAPDLDSALSVLAPSLVAAAVAGFFIGICAGTLAPFRRPFGSFAVAWALAAAPLFLISLLLILGEVGPGRFMRECGAVASRHMKNAEFAGMILGTALVMSALTAVAARFAVRASVAKAVRMAARKRRETFAMLRGTTPRSIGAFS
jgi:hypothetical protein